MRRSVENTCPIFPSYFFLPDLDVSLVTARKGKTLKSEYFWVALLRSDSPLMDILACRSEENSYNILPSAATMLFHGLPGGDVHGVVEEMDRRGKSESAAISSAIDMGESETVGEIHWPSRLVSARQHGSLEACDSGCTLAAPGASIHIWTLLT